MGLADILRFEAAMAAAPRPRRLLRPSLQDQIEPFAPKIASYRALGHEWAEIAGGLAEFVVGRNGHPIDANKLRSLWSRHFKHIEVEAAADYAVSQHDRDEVRKLGLALADLIQARKDEQSAFERERAVWAAERSQMQVQSEQAISIWRNKHAALENRIAQTENSLNATRYKLTEEQTQVAAAEDRVHARWRNWAGKILARGNLIVEAEMRAEVFAQALNEAKEQALPPS